MTNRLKVEFGALGELISGLEASANRLEEQLSELDAGLARVTQSWEGEAHDRFRVAFAQWRATSKDLHRTLRDLHKVTRTAHGNYHAAESANLRIWGGA